MLAGRRAPARRALRASRPGETRRRRDDRRPRARCRARAAARRACAIAAVADLRPDAGRPASSPRASGRPGIELLRGDDGRARARAPRRRAARCSRASTRDGQALDGHAQRAFPATCSPSRGGTAPATLAAAAGRRAGALRRGDRPLPAPTGCTTVVHAAGAVAGHERRRRGRAVRARSPAPRRRSRSASAAPPARARARPRAAARPAPAPVARSRRRRRMRATRRGGGKAFVDLDEDVTVKDIALRGRPRATTRSSSPSATRP